LFQSGEQTAQTALGEQDALFELSLRQRSSALVELAQDVVGAEREPAFALHSRVHVPDEQGMNLQQRAPGREAVGWLGRGRGQCS
jgi:hypothetical protein